MNALVVYWDILKQDLRYIVRMFNRARGFALIVILVTALGVGVNIVAFSVADFVLLRLLLFADFDAFVCACEGLWMGVGWGCMNELLLANYRDFKVMSSTFEVMGVFMGSVVNFVGIGELCRFATTPITTNMLP